MVKKNRMAFFDADALIKVNLMVSKWRQISKEAWSHLPLSSAQPRNMSFAFILQRIHSTIVCFFTYLFIIFFINFFFLFRRALKSAAWVQALVASCPSCLGVQHSRATAILLPSLDMGCISFIRTSFSLPLSCGHQCKSFVGASFHQCEKFVAASF